MPHGFPLPFPSSCWLDPFVSMRTFTHRVFNTSCLPTEPAVVQTYQQGFGKPARKQTQGSSKIGS